MSDDRSLHFTVLQKLHVLPIPDHILQYMPNVRDDHIPRDIPPPPTPEPGPAATKNVELPASESLDAGWLIGTFGSPPSENHPYSGDDRSRIVSTYHPLPSTDLKQLKEFLKNVQHKNILPVNKDSILNDDAETLNNMNFFWEGKIIYLNATTCRENRCKYCMYVVLHSSPSTMGCLSRQTDILTQDTPIDVCRELSVIMLLDSANYHNIKCPKYPEPPVYDVYFGTDGLYNYSSSDNPLSSSAHSSISQLTHITDNRITASNNAHKVDMLGQKDDNVGHTDDTLGQIYDILDHVGDALGHTDDALRYEPTIQIREDPWHLYTTRQLHASFIDQIYPELTKSSSQVPFYILYAGRRISSKGLCCLIKSIAPYSPCIYVPNYTRLEFYRDVNGEFSKVHIVPIKDTVPETYQVDIYNHYLLPYISARPLKRYGEGDVFRYQGIQFKVIRTFPSTRSINEFRTSRSASTGSFCRRGDLCKSVVRMRIGLDTQIYHSGTVPPTLEDVIGPRNLMRLRKTPARFIHYQLQIVLSSLFPQDYLRLVNLHITDIHSARIKKEMEAKRLIKDILIRQFTVSVFGTSSGKSSETDKDASMCVICLSNLYPVTVRDDKEIVDEAQSTKKAFNFFALSNQTPISLSPHPPLSLSSPPPLSLSPPPPSSPYDTILSLPCGHGFHLECVEHWLDRSTFCPVCKRDWVTYIDWDTVSTEESEKLKDIRNDPNQSQTNNRWWTFMLE